MIRITSARDGFRRCNIEHSKSPKDYPDDFFSEKDLNILLAEPMLAVQVNMPDCDAVIANMPRLEDMDEDKLKNLCFRMGIKHAAKAKKPDLIELIKANTAEPPAEG